MSAYRKGEKETMCSTTKGKIAGTLRHMMTERPFQKITVQNLMDASGMKRQSFYYHFQDTRDVLQWICRQELLQPLEESELEFEAWLLYGMELLERDRAFYRRAAAVWGREFVSALEEEVLRPRIARLFYDTEDFRRLDDGQTFCVRFGAKAVAAHALEFINSRQSYDPAVVQTNLRCLLGTLKLNEA